MDMEAIVTILLCVRDIKPELKRHYKSAWFIFMLRSFTKAGRMFKQTKWAKRKDKEAEYVKSIIILAAIYKNLLKRYPREKSLEIMAEVILRLSYTVDYQTARKNLLFTIKEPFQRWLKYRSILITEGFGLHNDVEDILISKGRMHYIVKRCIFHDTFVECGTPELTRLICDYDRSYHSSMFPEFYFDRNGSWENTLGYGAEICHYVWKDKETLNKEFRAYLTKEKEKKRKAGEERRSNIRRQADRRQNERRRFSRRKLERRSKSTYTKPTS